MGPTCTTRPSPHGTLRSIIITSVRNLHTDNLPTSRDVSTLSVTVCFLRDVIHSRIIFNITPRASKLCSSWNKFLYTHRNLKFHQIFSHTCISTPRQSVAAYKTTPYYIPPTITKFQTNINSHRDILRCPLDHHLILFVHNTTMHVNQKILPNKSNLHFFPKSLS